MTISVGRNVKDAVLFSFSNVLVIGDTLITIVVNLRTEQTRNVQV